MDQSCIVTQTSLDKCHDICLDIYDMTNFNCHVIYDRNDIYDTLERHCLKRQNVSNPFISRLYTSCAVVFGVSHPVPGAGWCFCRMENREQRKVSPSWRPYNDNSLYMVGLRLSSVYFSVTVERVWSRVGWNPKSGGPARSIQFPAQLGPTHEQNSKPPGPTRPIDRWGTPDFKGWTEKCVKNALVGRWAGPGHPEEVGPARRGPYGPPRQTMI